MSSIPYAVYHATEAHAIIRKQRDNNGQSGGRRQNGPTLSKLDDNSNTASIGEMYRYNLKFMNSVWGLYNRYAPQAFQKNLESLGSGQ